MRRHAARKSSSRSRADPALEGRVTEHPRTEGELRTYIPSRRNWGRWGQDDQLGTIKLVTAKKRVQAASLVRSGRLISLSRPLPTVQTKCGQPPATQNPNRVSAPALRLERWSRRRRDHLQRQPGLPSVRHDRHQEVNGSEMCEQLGTRGRSTSSCPSLSTRADSLAPSTIRLWKVHDGPKAPTAATETTKQGGLMALLSVP